MSAGNDMGRGGPAGDELAMIDAKKILKAIILKMATESLGTFKQDFLGLPLNEQKRILREHGLKQGFLSRGPSLTSKAVRLEPPDFPNAALASVLEHLIGILELPAEQQEQTQVQKHQEQQPQSPPPLPIDSSYTDFSMAYGLRRCRLCGYNEGPLPCPSDCYNMAVPTPTPSSFEETGQSADQ